MRTVSSHGRTQSLHEAAVRLVAPVADAGSLDGLRTAIKGTEDAADENDSQDGKGARQAAIERYVDSSCDIDIDDHCLAHHNGSDGWWVGAWLWVPDEHLEESIEGLAAE